MRIHSTTIAFALSVNILSAAAAMPFRNPALTIQQRVNDLVARMTLEEKVSQLIDRAAPYSPAAIEFRLADHNPVETPRRESGSRSLRSPAHSSFRIRGIAIK
jgi:hypothetical protein